MDFETLDAGLLAWLAALTGLSAGLCVKVNAPRPFAPDGKILLTQWVSIPQVGLDAEEWDYDADAVDPLDELTPTMHGDRRMTLQVDVESQTQTSGLDAQHLLQRVVDRCRAPSSRATLTNLNLALAGVSPVRRTDYPFDGRVVARATLELTFNAVSTFTDTAGRTATIQHVEIDATVPGSSGTNLPDTVDSGGTFP